MLVAFHEAKQIGVSPARKAGSRGVEGIIQQRNPDFSYLYGLYLRYQPYDGDQSARRQPGPLAACNIALRMWGDTAVTDAVLTEWLDRLIVRNGWLDMGRKRPNPARVAFHGRRLFLLLRPLLRDPVRRTASAAEHAFYQDHLARILLSHQERDGSWWDYPLYNYHQQYGTAFALMSLEHSRTVVAPRSG